MVYILYSLLEKMMVKMTAAFNPSKIRKLLKMTTARLLTTLQLLSYKITPIKKPRKTGGKYLAMKPQLLQTFFTQDEQRQYCPFLFLFSFWGNCHYCPITITIFASPKNIK